MATELTPADVMAMNNGMDNAWNNPFVYLIWIYAFRMFGGGFGYGYGDAATQGALTRAELYDGFNHQNTTNDLRTLSAGQTGIAAAVKDAQFASQQCCCETNRNIDAVRYENAKNTCDIIAANNLNTRDLLEAQNAGTQRIIDYLTNQEINTLRTDLQAAQLTLANNVQTNAIINAVRPFPQPAYITCSP